MPDPQVRIDNLHLRIPGDDVGAGERLATGLRDAAASVPITRSRHYGAMRLRVEVPHDATEADTLRAVHHAFTRALHQE